ncbi:MAG: META domain-containing protein [Bacteroidales bacterium]|nr:META domain-containing protein [Bacteroidales bacterium]
MKSFKNVIILFIIILIGSCENDSNNDNGINSLKDSKWILISFQPHDTQIEEFKPGNIKEMNIEFTNENTVHAVSSCNTFDGNFSIQDPDTLKIYDLCTMLINCENDTITYWENKYYYELKNAENYYIEANRLTIETKSNIAINFKAD